MSPQALWELGINSLKELEADSGILASHKQEAYGCIFGRDALITSLLLLKANPKSDREYMLTLIERSLMTLSNLQGRHYNIESGEEPGKIVHEYRPSDHEHLTKLAENPWYLYPEGVMRNYDSVDATPLFLLAVHEYSKVGDKQFTTKMLPAVRAALSWLLHDADHNGDGLVDYEFPPARVHGGLKVQSWMDSTESLFDEMSDERPTYPVAPVEVQAYAWAALLAWADYFYESDVEFSDKLRLRATILKEKFNEHFVLDGGTTITLAYAIDGNGKKLTAARSSQAHVLWSAYKGESILKTVYVERLRKRVLARDLFVPKAGIRTLSSRSLHFDPMSYHNGSIWPHDSAILAQGLEQFGYEEDAKQVRKALINAYQFFKTPLELFAYRRGFKEYLTPSGHKACRIQAWSTAALLCAVKVD